MAYGRVNVGGGGGQEVYILKTASGDTAYLQEESEEIVPLTATADDIRLGKKAVIGTGVVDGAKDIPQYRTTTGARYIPANTSFEIPLPEFDMFNYTELQAMTMPYNTDMDSSIAVNRAVIKDKVYNTGATTVIATVTKDSANKTISLNIANGNTPAVIRYFTYKEESL